MIDFRFQGCTYHARIQCKEISGEGHNQVKVIYIQTHPPLQHPLTHISAYIQIHTFKYTPM